MDMRATRFRIRTSISLVTLLVALISVFGVGLPKTHSAVPPRISVQPSGKTNPYLSLQPGRELEPTYTTADPGGYSLQNAGAATMSDQARPLALASADFNGDGFADLLCAYADAGGGVLALHTANPEAIAPRDPVVIRGIASGHFPDPFFKNASVVGLPAAPDLLAAGDFTRDGKADVLAAARGGNSFFLLTGDGGGSFFTPQRIELPGVLTALAAGEVNQSDGATDLVLGVRTRGGASLLVYGGTESLQQVEPVSHALPAEATSLAVGRLDDDRFNDIAIAAGGQLLILQGAQEGPGNDQVGEMGPIALPFVVEALALGDFVWDRDSRTEISVLDDNGAAHILARGELDTRPMTAQEVLEGRRRLAKLRDKAVKRGRPMDSELRDPGSFAWRAVRDISAADDANSGSSEEVMLSARMSALPSDDLLIVNRARNRLRILYRETPMQGEIGVSARSDAHSSVTLESEGELAAVLPMRVNVDARPGLVILSKRRGAPTIIMPMAATTFTVTRSDDPAPDGCVVGDCSLREAIIAANANAGADTIVFNSGINPTLTISSGSSFESGAATGDLDINDSVSIVGNGPANTVISTSYTSACGDCKVFGINQDGIFNGLSVSFTGVTIQNGFNNGANFQGTFYETGGGVDFFMTSSGNSHSMTNCVIANNTASGSFLSHGGGVNVDSFNTASVGGPSAGTVTFTGCTFSGNTADQEGGGLNLSADKHDVNVISCTASSNQTVGLGGNSHGGGIDIEHSFGGTVAINGGAVSNNTAAGLGGGVNITFNPSVSMSNVAVSGNTSTASGSGSALGGGVAIAATGVAGLTATISLSGVTISSNHADNGAVAQGGGVYFNSFYSAALSNCSISANTSRSGAGVFNGGSSATPQATLTVAGGSITGNTAAASGGGAGVLSANTAISDCTITGNSAATSGGGLFVSGGTLNASLSRIAGNTSPAGSGIAHTAGTAMVENNWWGCDGFPNAAGCQTGTGTFDADPRVDLRLLPTSATLAPGGMQTFTADVSQNTNGATINPVVLNGLTVTFGNTAGLGSASPGMAVIASLTASTTFTANATCPSPNTGTVSATLDNGTETSSVTVEEAPGITCPSNQVVSNDPDQCSASVTFSTTAPGCPAPTVNCKIGSTTITSPHTFPVGFTTVTCTASNGVGADASCSFSVTVNDTQPPNIGPCPADITTDEHPPGSGSATVTYATPPSSDNCLGQTVVCNPPSGSSFPAGTTTVTCTATDASNNTASCQFTVTVNAQGLTALSPALVWIGLKNSDDVGTKFDLLAEALKNGSVVGSGQLNDVPGGSSGFNNAVLRTITLALGSSVSFGSGDTLSFRVSVRIAATSGHTSGTARLWYNGAAIDSGAGRDAGSRFDATIGGSSADYFLRTGFVLDTTAGSSRTFVDKTVSRAGGNPFVAFGTWSKTF